MYVPSQKEKVILQSRRLTSEPEQKAVQPTQEVGGEENNDIDNDDDDGSSDSGSGSKSDEENGTGVGDHCGRKNAQLLSPR